MLRLQPYWPPLLGLKLKNIFINFLEFPIQIPCHLEIQFLSVSPLLFFSCLLTMMELLILYISPVLGAKRSDHL